MKDKYMSRLIILTAALASAAMVASAQEFISSTIAIPVGALYVSDSMTVSLTTLIPNTSAPMACNMANDTMVALNAKRQPCYCNGAASAWQQQGTSLTTTGVTILGIAVIGAVSATNGPVTCSWNP